ncbi:hypothetical protein GE061_017217 [Apolygus lucorum]|uniref:Uncharacterized protein n=1 Tax=Apolygus lucorum TaxID=248454 RepID=A0A8S9XAK6_APOLU|nr:hypothetical protein GE061_017217 [Apolygus lucorum]
MLSRLDYSSPRRSDITAHDTRSTMKTTLKLLLAAVVIVSFVEAIDKETFFKLTLFDGLEKKHDVGSLIAFMTTSSRLYLRTVAKFISLCVQTLPNDLRELKWMRAKLDDMALLLTDDKIVKSLVKFLSGTTIPANNDVYEGDIRYWKNITETGFELTNTLSDALDKIKNNKAVLPLFRTKKYYREGIKKADKDFKMISTYISYLDTMSSIVQRTLERFDVYIRKFDVTGTRGFYVWSTDTLMDVQNTLDYYRREFSKWSSDYLRMTLEGKLPHGEFNERSQPLYEDIQNIIVLLHRLESGMVTLTRGFILRSAKDEKKHIETLAKDQWNIVEW